VVEEVVFVGGMVVVLPGDELVVDVLLGVVLMGVVLLVGAVGRVLVGGGLGFGLGVLLWRIWPTSRPVAASEDAVMRTLSWLTWRLAVSVRWRARRMRASLCCSMSVMVRFGRAGAARAS